MCEFYIFRALSDKKINMAANLTAENLLSEAMSRVMESSSLNKYPYFCCWTEDPRIAYRYSKKPGYSGKVARIKIRVCEDGTLEIVGNKNAEVYRTWHMEDWLFLAQKSNWPNVATNINYSCPCPQKTIASIITYSGRRSPRAYAHADKTFILHADKTLNYEILKKEQIRELISIKKYFLISYRCLHYNVLDDPLSQKNIREILEDFKEKYRENPKVYTKNIIDQLEDLIES